MCRPIAQGRIVPVVGSLQDLEPVLRHHAPFDAIAANFAVLNHVDDLEPVFRTLAPHLRSGGVLVASLLNPRYETDVRWRGWWKLVPASLRSGAITYRGMVTTHRHYHYMRTIRRMARPHLTWEELGHIDGTGSWSAESTGWRETLKQQFRFVVLRRGA